MTRGDHAPPDLAGLTDALLAAARAAGATEADAVAVSGDSISVDVRAGALEQATRAQGVEIGLRVLIGGRQACVSASDLTPRTIAEMAERAVAMAREAPVDDMIGLADPGALSAVRDGGGLALDDGQPQPAPEALLDLALRAEAAALAVPGVRMAEQASAWSLHRRFWLARQDRRHWLLRWLGGFRQPPSSGWCR